MDYRGVPVVGAYAPLVPTDDPASPRWVILAEIDLEEALGPMTALEKELGLLALATIALFVVVLALASRMVTRPLRALEAAATGIAGGDWERRVAVEGNDEFARVGGAFNAMAAKVEETLEALTRANHSLQASEAVLADAQRIARLGSWEREPGAPALTWSDEHYRIFGVQPGEFQPTLDNIMRFVHPEDRAAFERAARSDAGRIDIDYRIVRGRGDVRYLHTFGVATDGGAGYFHGTTQDITERKHLELALREQFDKLKQLDELKTSFVNSVTHDLRTPLTSILGYEELLEDGMEGELTEGQVAVLRTMRRSSLQLNGMINDLLDFARMEAGTFELTLSEVDMVELMRAEIETVRPQLMAAGLKLEADLPEGLPLVLADAARVERVVANYLSNAIKFTRRGGTIRVAARVEGGDFVGEVSDTGIGIAADDLPRLFQRFSQLDAGKQHRGGTGLGLSICRMVAEAHGGTVGVQSEPGHGARFWFRLPLGGPPPR